MATQLSSPLLVRGKVVSSDGSAKDRYIYIKNGVIESITRSRPALTDDVIFVQTGPEEWIFPGLLDLHTHANYNLLPLWESGNFYYDNRFEWRSDTAYKEDVRGPFNSIKNEKATLAVFSELQAVAGGTTVLQESADLEKDLVRPKQTLICRDTADTKDLLLDGSKKIFSVVDFFRPDNGIPKQVNWSIDAYLENRENGTLLATLAHVAEGRSGFGSRRGHDKYSRLEFEEFMKHPAFFDADAVKSTPFSIIHGCGIDARNPGHISFLTERNISIIWSPVSNLLLYGDTIDVEALLENGINVALGSDWSPSGSKHVWDEAKFARRYLSAIGSSISDEKIFQMVTTNAAKCLGLSNLGEIEEGANADFFILRSQVETDNAIEVFFSTTDKDVVATVIGGQPVYGAKDFLEEFKLTTQDLPAVEGSSVVNKAVAIDESIEVDVSNDISILEKKLKEGVPSVKRSNLLSSSDKLYQRRIQMLTSTVERFAWSVKLFKKYGPGETGTVKVPCNSVRVWRGYRKSDLTIQKFSKNLGTIFIPSAVYTQAPLGMTAYLPILLPFDKQEGLPDEIALVFYESQEVYGKTFSNAIGRGYGLLHATTFAPTRDDGIHEYLSASGWPEFLAEDFEYDKAYHLLNNEADWQKGTVRLLIGTKKEDLSVDEFKPKVLDCLNKIQNSSIKGLDGAIVTASDNYFIYWEHWEEKSSDHIGYTDMKKNLDVAVDQDVTPTKIANSSFAESKGLDLKGGECMNIQFVRRREYLW